MNVFNEAIAYHWVVSTAFNIPLGDIFAMLATTHHRMFVVVKHKGLEFTIEVGGCDLSESEFSRAWPKAAAVHNAKSAEEKTAMIDGTAARANAVNLIAAMMEKGFKGVK